MEKPAYRTWAEIDLDIIAKNMREIKKIVAKDTKVMAVVKADAYGHGYLNVSKVMLKNGADYLGVACIDEAEQIRRHGIKEPILILGYTSHNNLKRVVENDIIPTIYYYDDAEYLSKIAAKYSKKSKIHVKIDTGMNRLGFISEKPESLNEIKKMSELENIEIEGIFTHLSCADGEEDDYSLMQFERFIRFCDKIDNMGIKISIKHVCNSAGILKYKFMHLDMVRAGIISYGLYPSKHINKSILNLLPAMSIKTVVTRIQYISKGEKISYGGTFTTPLDMKIATIPIGYADGYIRAFQGKAKVIAGNEYAEIVGRICMDQCMIDVTNVNTINVEDEVIIIGEKGDKSISFDKLAEAIGTINYELLCLVGKRVPRVYLSDGNVTDVLSYLV